MKQLNTPWKSLILSVCLILLFISNVIAVPADFLETQKLDFNIESAESQRAGERPYYFEEVHSIKFGTTHGSDIWGWRHSDGNQYAIMGIQDGVMFFNVNTLTPADSVMGSDCLWQDIKTYQNYAYAVSECNSSLRVIDMQYLPDSVHLVGLFDTNNDSDVSSHNIAIDTSTGYLYVEGSSGTSTIHIFSLANPENPTYVSSFGSGSGVHDFFIHGDTCYIAGGYDENFSIYDVSNKLLPVRIAFVTIPNAGYVHNIWPTADRRHVITTEETTGKTVKCWNIEDLSNVRLLGEYLASGPNPLAHNAHMEGNIMYLSHYGNGVSVVDWSIPYCPQEIAVYDLPNDNTWGVFPHTGDSLVYSSNMDGTMYILRLKVDPAYVDNSSDDDADGVSDDCDNCLGLSNPDQADADTDGLGDLCDACPNDPDNDDDGDGVCGDVDNCENYNPGQEDTDGDGIADACDTCPNDADDDFDGDGLCADLDNCPNISNELQIDDDNDGVGNLCDVCPGEPVNDDDEDGLCGSVDNCPYSYNPLQVDSDGDGVGDACDNCNGLSNPSQADIDNDNVGDDCDNCLTVANNSQVNSDTDSLGDACDNCPTVDNPDQADFDMNNEGDACCCQNPGDIDHSGGASAVDITDLTLMVDFMFRGGLPAGCPLETDLDGSGLPLNITDLTYLVDYLFRSGPAPVACP